MKVKKAIIPAAGLGTRVLPASKAVPKEMLNIVDKPAIQYLVEAAVAMLSSAARASSATSRSPFSTATMSPSATTR